MTPADLTLARRAVACAGWRWVPGMRSTCGRIVYAVGVGWVGGVREGDSRVRPDCSALAHDALPDFDDDATLGRLRGLVREAHGDPLIYTQPAEIEGVLCWLVWHGDSARAAATERPIAMGHNEAAALVAALEAACQE